MHDQGRDEHLNLLLQGVDVWNRWRADHPNIRPDLRGVTLHKPLQRAILGRAILENSTLDSVDLSYADLAGANLRGASLLQTNLRDADLSGADLTGADLTQTIMFNAQLTDATLTGATLSFTNLRQANLKGVDLSQMDLRTVSLFGAKLAGAILREAVLTGVDLPGADLTGAKLESAKLASAKLALANLTDADLTDADLTDAILRQANLTNTIMDGATLHNTDLTQAQLIGTSLRNAKLSDCSVYGISTWDLSLDHANQTNLRITPDSDVEITADNLEVAQFLYLMLHNEKIRQVIDTITSKVVLILGRFTPDRKRVLDMLRNELRRRNYLPVVFDFEGPKRQNTTETVTLLARMARFVIADVTQPRSVPHELASIVPTTAVPVQTLLLEGEPTYAMFTDLLQYPWMLPIYYYRDLDALIAGLADHVIAPAEVKVAELQGQRTHAVDTAH